VKTKDTVSALDRGLALLQCFSVERSELGPTELARLTGIPRPSVSRLAATLVAHRWLREAPGGERFMLGAGPVSLAQVFLAGLDVRAAARAPMQALAESSGGSVYLGLRDGLEIVLVEACRPRSSMLAARLDVGSRVPLPNSALGRAYLGAVDADTRARLLESLRLARGSDWPALEAGLQRALAEREKSGWCLSAGDFHREINSVSVALTDARGDVMSFNCGGAAYQFSEERLRSEVGPALRRMVEQIAVEIGGRA
jgi:DNA-binding IclR family transcriptional regulator